jgi:hypothetical protein
MQISGVIERVAAAFDAASAGGPLGDGGERTNERARAPAVRVMCTIGGANVQRQIEKLRRERPHVLVGTPGRLVELVEKHRKLKLSHVSTLVLDEVGRWVGGSVSHIFSSHLVSPRRG